jgi:flagellar hook-associated protein 1 FlgK
MIENSTAGLLADQSALNVTSNNVANQNTAGYVRQVVNWTAGDYVTLGNSQESSTGPTVTVTSARDSALERQVQALQQTVAAATSRSSVLNQISDVFGVTSSGSAAGSTQLGSTMNAFYASLTLLASNPSDIPTRQGVVSAAQALASSFNSAAAQLSQLTSTLNEQVSSTVAQVNALTQTVATLNGKISALSPNADAGTLEDQRQTAIEQLSQYIGLNQNTTEKNGITLTTKGGTPLVVGTVSHDIAEQNSAAGGAQILDAAGNDVTSGVLGGSLGGLLAGVNTDVPDALSGLNAMAFWIDNKTNEINSHGIDLYGNQGGHIFAYLPSSDTSAVDFAAVATAQTIATASPTEGTSGNTNAVALAALGQTGTVGSQVGDPTYAEYYAALLSQVGTQTASLNSQASAQQAALTQLTTTRDSESAVSLDEEASNLTQYQRSYEAAAKVFSIASMLMADAINLGVQTSVS